MRPLLLTLVVLALLACHCGARTGLRVHTIDATDATDAPPDVTPRFDCRPDPAVRCNDANACTTDLCRPDGVCDHATIRCFDGDPCTADQCAPATGCVFPRTECGGCADGQREAFGDRARYPDITACSGGFDIPGLARPTSPACGRAAGDDGPNPLGTGCAASDLCAVGWHVCTSAGDVASHSVDGCAGAGDAPPGTFYASRQTGPGCLQCATGSAGDCTALDCRTDCAPTAITTNDIFGCGNVGSIPQNSCAPLDRSGNNLCSMLPAPWACGTGPGADVRESEYVSKPGSDAGGVLCCRD
ncbi:MAG: hypothetical protein WCJ30_10680 [Deltaproteobacteria bacterium]